MVRKIGYYKNKNLIVLRTISKSEEETIHRFLDVIGDYTNDRLLYRLVESNYLELINSIKQYSDKVRTSNSETKIDNEFLDEVFFELNRLILNFLTVFRTYTDHNEARIKHEFGKNSDEIKIFKDATAEEFDNNFTYRFFSQFRNYCQHCGMPVSSVSVKNVIDSDDKKSSRLLLELDSEELLKKHDWKAIVTQDLINIAGKFDLIELILNFEGALNKIQDKVLTIRKDKLISAFNKYLSYCFCPKVGMINVCIVHSDSEKDYIEGKMTLYPVTITNNKEVIDELFKLGVANFDIELTPFMVEVMRDLN